MLKLSECRACRPADLNLGHTTSPIQSNAPGSVRSNPGHPTVLKGKFASISGPRPSPPGLLNPFAGRRYIGPLHLGAGMNNAVGCLKEELRRIGALFIEAADATAVPAGGALAVDREEFSNYIS